MNLDAYHCSVNPTTGLYEFYSEGPKGSIKKVIDYQYIKNGNDVVGYNLCFGDWDERAARKCDRQVTNNNDKNKVLSTVADSIMDFTNKNPGCFVYGEGSTAARTRLYQMTINSNWEMITSFFSVKGKINDEWESFQHNRNYEAILARRK
ncbi:DUF6934 family protein [Chitinophaga sp. YR627]|uniref:DUF6934 family protein n=1 Tax=Chitinophaga sp. YR627 TaxID=1881041 RepID=UPI0015A69ECD|nr:hypothetical protein [Chitinophaga sp. YR627]